MLLRYYLLLIKYLSLKLSCKLCIDKNWKKKSFFACPGSLYWTLGRGWRILGSHTLLPFSVNSWSSMYNKGAKSTFKSEMSKEIMKPNLCIFFMSWFHRNFGKESSELQSYLLLPQTRAYSTPQVCLPPLHSVVSCSPLKPALVVLVTMTISNATNQGSLHQTGRYTFTSTSLPQTLYEKGARARERFEKMHLHAWARAHARFVKQSAEDSLT